MKDLERIAIIGDFHGNLAALEAVLGATQDVDGYIILGDYVGYGPQPREVVAVVKELVARVPVAAVVGNHDLAVLSGTYNWDGVCVRSGEEWEAWTADQLSAEQREFLRRLPRAIEGELVGTRGEAGVWFHAEHNLPGASRYVRHDTPEDEIAPLIVQAEAQLFLFGHTHTVIDRVVAGKRIVNPGSVGQPRDGCPHAAFAVWENGTLEFRRVAYDVARTVQALEATPLSVKQKQMWARNLQEGIVIAESRPDLEASGLV